MDNDENNIKNKIIINKEKQITEENNTTSSSFCEEFSGIIGKDLFKEEQKPSKDGIKIKETVLDNKISKKLKLKETKITSFIQSPNINELEKSLNISLTDKNKEEKEFLKLRKFPEFDINEYDKIKKRVGKNLLNISNFLLNKQLKLNLCEINPNKKIGPLLPLTKLIENAYSYNPVLQNEMQKKYLRLKNYICNYRTVFGDGNCFYRGVMFRYIELLILNKKKDFIKLLILDMNKIYTNPETKLYLIFNNYKINYELIIQIMIIIYELVENNNIIQAHQAFYKAIICSKDFDFLLIFYLRFILCQYIKANENKLYMKNFPVLIGNLLPSIYEKNGVFDFNSFYNHYLLKMFIPAEKIIVYLTPFVLGINLEIILFDDNEDDVIKKFVFCEGDNSSSNDNDVIKNNLQDLRQNIFLINIKYHYENVFNYFDNKNFNEVYQYYRNDLNPIYIKEDDTMKNLYIKIKKGNKNNNNNINNNKNNYDNNIPQTNEINIKKEENINNKNNINNNNINTQNNKLCIICQNMIYKQNKTIKNICNDCLFIETFIQIKKYYIDYIKLMLPKINQITKNDLNNFFMNKIKVNIFEKILNINQITEEMEFSNKKVSYIKILMSRLKQSICLYCYKDINNNTSLYKLPCGCNFCSVQHLAHFFKNIVTNKLSYNYKCLCAIEYKPYQVFELCNFLYRNKIYNNNENYERHLNWIFKNFCCKCGKNKNILYTISVDNIVNKFHNICEECNKEGNFNHNKILYCFICNKQHTYI